MPVLLASSCTTVSLLMLLQQNLPVFKSWNTSYGFVSHSFSHAVPSPYNALIPLPPEPYLGFLNTYYSWCPYKWPFLYKHFPCPPEKAGCLCWCAMPIHSLNINLFCLFNIIIFTHSTGIYWTFTMFKTLALHGLMSMLHLTGVTKDKPCFVLFFLLRSL